MCTLAVKPAGVDIPCEEYLKNMFKNNPNGSGIAYVIGGKIKIIKGLMDESDFLKACSLIPVEAVAIIHSRITTSGGTCKELTHPYRLCSDIKEMRRTKAIYTDGFVVGHNGIFNEFKTKDLNNDTTQFIVTYLNNLNNIGKRAGGDILASEFKPIIERLVCGSKLAILASDGRVEMFGSGWICDGGSYFSNSNYKPYTPSYNSGYYYNGDAYKKYLRNYNNQILNKDLLQLIKDGKVDREDVLYWKKLGYFESEILEWYGK